MIGRNDPCHCGSGKKYKKCCLDKDKARVVELDDSAVESFRPAGFPSGSDRYAPAIACMTDEGKTCVFVLVRASRPLFLESALDEADWDLDSIPGSSDDSVGPECMRYLDKIGYRKMPGLGLESLDFGSGVSEDYGDDDEDYPGDDEEDDLDEGESDPQPGLLDRCDDTLYRIQRIASLPPVLLASQGVLLGIAIPLAKGYCDDSAIVMVLEAAVAEAEKMKEAGASEPDEERLTQSLLALPDNVVDDVE
jgi:hypothetical protein